MSVFITGLILGALITAAVVRTTTGYPTKPAHIKHLNNAEVAIINAVGDVMFPDGGEIPMSAREANVVSYIDKYLGWHAPGTRLLMHLLFYLIEHATLIFVPSFRRMSNLGEAQRIAYLDAWENSRFYPRRMVFQSLRALMCMGYLNDANVLRAIGYKRPEACRAKELSPAA